MLPHSALAVLLLSSKGTNWRSGRGNATKERENGKNRRTEFIADGKDRIALTYVRCLLV